MYVFGGEGKQGAPKGPVVLFFPLASSGLACTPGHVILEHSCDSTSSTDSSCV